MCLCERVHVCMHAWAITVFLIGLTDVSFHLTDVSIYLTEVPLQLTRFSLQFMEAL